MEDPANALPPYGSPVIRHWSMQDPADALLAHGTLILHWYMQDPAHALLARGTPVIPP